MAKKKQSVPKTKSGKARGGAKRLTVKGLYKKFGYTIDDPPRRWKEEYLEPGKRLVVTDTHIKYHHVWNGFWVKNDTNEYMYHEKEFHIFVRVGQYTVADEGHTVASTNTLSEWLTQYEKDRENIFAYWKEVHSDT